MQTSSSAPRIVGILLAAGRGRRFDPAGRENKLMQQTAQGVPVAVQAARNLLAALPAVTAVVRDAESPLARELAALGCGIAVCADADHGMAASLRCGLSAAADADGWLVALADMPHVAAATSRALAQAIAAGAEIAAPFHDGRRGNPVAFGRSHLSALLALEGDQGARALLQTAELTRLDVADPGIHHDIDTPADLQR